MNFRRVNFVLSALLLGSALVARPVFAAPAGDVLVRLHWLGLKQISADTNAASLMKVWQLPQTTALVAQTLDKISRLPVSANTNAAALLRALLDDLITNEFYLEVGRPANSPLATRHPSLILALRLPAARARLWETNLPAALPAAELSQSGEWTLVGLGLGTNGSPAGFAARVAAVDPQFSSLITHHSSLPIWLAADFTSSCLAAVDPSLSSLVTRHSSLAHVHLTLTGEAGNILTRAILDFPRPLDLKLSPWNIPTNYIHQPLTCFTAVRGLAGWLAAWPAWPDLQLTNAPDQFFEWAQVQAGGPFVTYFAAPLPGASNQVRSLAERLVPPGNLWLATNGQGHLDWRTNAATLVWHECFIIDPFLKAVTANRQEFVLGGLIPYAEGNPNPVPTDVVQFVQQLPNLVYYDTEQTGGRLDDDFFILQLFRVVFHLPQLPAQAAGTRWLKNVEPLLGNSITIVTQSGPQQLAFARHATVGFTALELHLLADWLESPQFPHGLHTFLAPPDQ